MTGNTMRRGLAPDGRILGVAVAGFAALLAAALPALATEATIVVAASGGISVTLPDDSTPIQIGDDLSYDSSGGTAVSWPTLNAADASTLVSSLVTLADGSGPLGTITVVDDTEGVFQAWDATVSWTDFELTPGATAADEEFAISQLRYAAGTVTTDGSGTISPQLLPAASGDTPVSYVGVALESSTTTSWNPTIFIDQLDEQVGTFSGQITHSVVAS